jgi:very-short-patch-repair endonuclease
VTSRRPKLFDDDRDHSRRLRRRSTPAERKLWSRLRDRRHFNVKFHRQVPVGAYVVDFYCHEAKLVVEIDGGGHGLAGEIDEDVLRTEWLKRSGYIVLRFWNTEVMQNLEGVLSKITEAVVRPSP